MRKNAIALALAAVLVFALCPAAQGATLTCGDFRYTVKPGGEAVVSKYTGNASALTVPAELDGHPVVALGALSFAGKAALESVALPESVTDFGRGIFQGCDDVVLVGTPGSAAERYARENGLAWRAAQADGNGAETPVPLFFATPKPIDVQHHPLVTQQPVAAPSPYIAPITVPGLISSATPAPAEPAQSGFLFRGGVTWQSTEEQVREIEGLTEEDSAFDDGDLRMVRVEEAAVSNFGAELYYVFRNEQLLLAGYTFSDGDIEEEGWAYLRAALCQKYGEPAAPDPARVASLFTALAQEGMEPEQLAGLENWFLADGTIVFMTRFDGQQPTIAYANETAARENAYNLSGL